MHSLDLRKVAAVFAAISLLAAILFVVAIKRELAEAKRELAAAYELAATYAVQSKLNDVAASISDARSKNIAAAGSRTREAAKKVETSNDLDAALRIYGDGLERVRAAGHASISGSDTDGGG